ncbi:hypothetical protein PoB_005356400 [Plakobranchus ocellatus]|uniref:Uncharacterized protein n=1 Tax=Plakobranchus ocellatus TaxID=259542 RepID=A0AAV4C8M7_9GAST|nr:hypothetical protein PoB_005356400 [Plakobranchus ocellatus]
MKAAADHPHAKGRLGYHLLEKRLSRRASTLQAERMLKRNRADLRAGEQSDHVAVPVPPVDRGRGDPRNTLSVKIDRREDTDQYKIVVKAGILSGLYS